MTRLLAAATVGSWNWSIYSKMATGSVVTRPLAKNKESAKFPNETMNAKMAPVTMPGRIAGNVTRKKVSSGVAPSPRAASSR